MTELFNCLVYELILFLLVEFLIGCILKCEAFSVIKFGVGWVSLQGQLEVFNSLFMRPLIQSDITSVEVVNRVIRIAIDCVIVGKDGCLHYF